MTFLSLNIFELAAKKGISEKHTKLLLLCMLLLTIKFLVMPVLEWQAEIKEQTDFYNLQYRSEASITEVSNLIQQNSEELDNKLNEIKSWYYTGAVTANQVKLNDLIKSKVNELDLSLASNNSRKLYEKNGMVTIEYTVRARGYAESLQEFVYWLENVQPKLLLKNTRFSSSRGSAAAEVNVRFQQLIIKGQVDE
ncbi:hypothetical protein AN214_01185 [Pseudoalteromonas sp. P1-9]|uniref:hypothetical protein n=1 Tax=Pseudoalteromonas sp. P1-9 TaxID=1710354 RepID=UPI0006D5D66A|nr:hypothetical protein [Pseudoalteromonas sp. P1-9]KPV96725.1 hypothetical protein AN214_01185 [Pseudoalteromonas sp. P1-9]